MKKIDIYIDPFDPDDYIVHWDAQYSGEYSPSSFSLQIYKANSPHEEYEKISKWINPSTDPSFYIDRSSIKKANFDPISYKIMVRNNVTGEEEFHGPQGIVSIPKKSDFLIVRSKYKKFINFGNEVLILKRPLGGVRCPNYDPELGHVGKDCSICFGSGFLHEPSSFFFSRCFFDVDPHKKFIRNSEEEISVKYAEFPHFPFLATGDIVVDKMNNRFKIIEVDPVKPHNFVICQYATIRRVSNSDVEMKISIPQDFKDL